MKVKTEVVEKTGVRMDKIVKTRDDPMDRTEDEAAQMKDKTADGETKDAEMVATEVVEMKGTRRTGTTGRVDVKRNWTELVEEQGMTKNEEVNDSTMEEAKQKVGRTRTDTVTKTTETVIEIQIKDTEGMDVATIAEATQEKF